jgi:glutamine---fructose-6-phosphate transaminase (isomerizing)
LRFIDAVHAQGTCLVASRASVSAQLAGTDLAAWRTAPLVLAGMGASYNAIATVLPFYRNSLTNPVSALLASDLLAGTPAPLAERPAVIAVSQSGQSREIVESLRRAPPGARLGVTAEPGSALRGVVDAVVDLSISEDSAVRVIGYTTSVQGLGLIAEALVGASLRAQSSDDLLDHLQECIQTSERAAEEFLGDGAWPVSVDFVGTGYHAGTAAQGALLVREACRLHAAGYDTYQYLHGPIEAMQTGAALVAIGSDREIALARSLGRAGARVLLVTEAAVGPEAGVVVLREPTMSGSLSWLPGVVAVQVLAWMMAQRLGLAVETFQHHQDDTKVG